MTAARFVRFLLLYGLAGAGLAALILWLFPGTLEPPHRPVNVVEVREAPAGASQDGRMVREEGPVSYADAVDAAAPAVVNIFTAKRVVRRDNPFEDDPFFRRFFGDQQRERERTETNLGSGVIISSDGYILTNNHVVEGADEIQVALQDGRSSQATVVGTDPETDLAVLHVRLEPLPVITLGRSDELRVGDVVLAIGNPFGVGQTVTKGIVSATGRSQLGLSTFENFIQTDAAINPGNSGGALINAHGDVVGINTAIFSGSGGSHGIGFAIPARLARGVMESIIEHGRMIRGWAGVEVQNLSGSLAEGFGLDGARGVIVAGVMRDGPAAAAGLEPGDVIFRINGQQVGDVQDLLHLITEIHPGEEARIEGLSSGEERDWNLRVVERPAARLLNR
ncbi:serine protease DegS [Natronocella acetinitrilica]|uniref:Serine protease DegS n=1 Tax=Natronocella acetinitrilica TaxID=414046 RepID=A0AAE3G1E9_9GAMM|nr:trypsin-like peptidase domain-containing protein [Natronocella acetinitrilica]MCP1673876.1 serine protease DegS [Natronocella acetinitrilica]